MTSTNLTISKEHNGKEYTHTISLTDIDNTPSKTASKVYLKTIELINDKIKRDIKASNG